MYLRTEDYRSVDLAKAFVDKCEAEFDRAVDGAASYIASVPDCRAVTLSGPTCSGKTTAAQKLTAALEKIGKRAVTVSIDDFYLSRSEMEKQGITDFEGAHAIDTVYFRKVCDELAAFREALLPKYDFTRKDRVSLTPYTPKENDIFIFEGIQAIYPEILSCLSSFCTVSVFICVSDELKVDDTTFTPNEIRFIRRTVRDFYHRDSTVENTVKLWDSVRSNEEANIFPYVGNENVTLNSLIPYEIFTVGREYLDVLDISPKSGEYPFEVNSLKERLQKIQNTAFSDELIPKTSLLSEFAK